MPNFSWYIYFCETHVAPQTISIDDVVFSRCDFQYFWRSEVKMPFLEYLDKNSWKRNIFYSKISIRKFEHCDTGLTWPFSVVDLHGVRSENGFDFWFFRAKVTIDHVPHARKRILILVTFRDVLWRFVTWPWSWPDDPYITLMLTGYLQHPFEVNLAEFRAKAIDIAGSRLHLNEMSKFDLWPNLDPRFKVNIKILSMLWRYLVESFRTPPCDWRGSIRQLIHELAGKGSDPPPPPPRRSWVRNSPGCAWLKEGYRVSSQKYVSTCAKNVVEDRR